MKKRIVSLLLCLCMAASLLTSVSLTAYAATGQIVTLESDAWVMDSARKHLVFSTPQEGMFPAKGKKEQRYGFVHADGTIAVPFIYKEVENFHDGVALVTTVDGDKYLINHSGEKVFGPFTTNQEAPYHKHGDYGVIVVDERTGMDYVRIVDANFNDLLPGKTVFTFNKTSKTFFSTSDDEIYNYKGVKLADNTSGSEDATNRFLTKIYKTEDNSYKIGVFDSDGHFVCDFDTPTADDREVYVNDYFVVISGNYIDTYLYSADTGALLFHGNGSKEHSWTFYDNYVSVTKNGGTSALFDTHGTVFDFGRWDRIIPTANSNAFVVGVGGKYGFSDAAGNLLTELIYPRPTYDYPDEFDSRYISFGAKSGRDDTRVLVDPFTIKEVDEYKTYVIPRGCSYIAGLGADENGKTTYWIYDTNLNHLGRVVPSSTVESYYSGVFNMRTTPSSVLVMPNLIKVRLDGKYITFDQTPVIVNGRTLVPLRRIFELIGATVQWDGATGTVTSKKGDTTVTMQINNPEMTVNGTKITLDTPPTIVGRRTLVPVRAVAESFQMLVDWNPYSRTVDIFTS